MGIAAAATLSHIFGEDSATRKAARLYAPAAGEAYGNGSREAITVGSIDDITHQRAGKTWPPPYGYYARILRNIELYKPNAIFFDIALREFRQNDKTISAVCVFHHTVYVYELGADEVHDARITPELRDKIILLGTDRKFGGDYINSPINDWIPGVYEALLPWRFVASAD
jgi:CHASE2 domain-containing sensor protein